jgi:hypothetical protein
MDEFEIIKMPVDGTPEFPLSFIPPDKPNTLEACAYVNGKIKVLPMHQLLYVVVPYNTFTSRRELENAATRLLSHVKATYIKYSDCLEVHRDYCKGNLDNIGLVVLNCVRENK